MQDFELTVSFVGLFQDLSESGDTDFGYFDPDEDLDRSGDEYLLSLEYELGLVLVLGQWLLLVLHKSMVSTIVYEFCCFLEKDLLFLTLEGSCDFLHFGEYDR
jgi:hypothetical protein